MLSSQVKFSARRQTDRQTDRQTEKRTSVKQYAPDLSMRGIKGNKCWLPAFSPFLQCFPKPHF